MGKGSLPTLSLHDDDEQLGVIRDVTGPFQIAKALKELPQPLDWGITQPWTTLSVRRNGQLLGTLQHVRQSVHRWQIEMAVYKAWKLENDVEG